MRLRVVYVIVSLISLSLIYATIGTSPLGIILSGTPLQNDLGEFWSMVCIFWLGAFE